MQAYIQWATNPASGYQGYSILSNNDWRNLPKKDEPTGSETLDANQGWVHAIDVQGVSVQSFDHYSVLTSGAGLQVYGWNDDPVDWPSPWGIRWTFMLPTFNGQTQTLNTLQYLEVWGDTTFYPNNGTLVTTGGPASFYAWNDFPEPRANLTKHGIWVPSDCENCPHTEDDHGAASIGAVCDFGDCAGYDSLHGRHRDELKQPANQHSWREWLGG